MPSEGVRRQIDGLLDQAREAADRRDWAVAWRRLETALDLDRDNAEARALEAEVGSLMDRESERQDARGALLGGIGGIFVFSILLLLGAVPLIFLIKVQIDERLLWVGNRPFVWFAVLAFLGAMAIAGLAGLVWSLRSLTRGVRHE